MTSVVQTVSRAAPWKVGRLPTIPAELSLQLFYNKRDKLQFYNVNPAFTARIRSIKPLSGSVCPLYSGPVILRAFLYAREKWPTQPFRAVSGRALEAVYNSFRVDGLPRLVVSVSKDVEKPLRGKLRGTIRHRFKRRGTRAFRQALEGLRQEDPKFTCNLDMLISMNRASIEIPFEELVQGMKGMLKGVYPRIKRAGDENAEQSRRFLAEQVPEPEHVLKSLSKSADLSPEVVQTLEEVTARLVSKIESSSVSGRFVDMELMPDGNLSPISATRKPYQQPQFKKGRFLWPTASIEDNNRLSNLRLLLDDDQSTYIQPSGDPQDRLNASTLDNELDYLFGDDSRMRSSGDTEKVKHEPPTARTVKLDWPRPGSQRTESGKVEKP